MIRLNHRFLVGVPWRKYLSLHHLETRSNLWNLSLRVPLCLATLSVKGQPVMWLPPKVPNGGNIPILDEAGIGTLSQSKPRERKSEINVLFCFLPHSGAERSSLFFYLLYLISSSGHRWKEYSLWKTTVGSSTFSFCYVKGNKGFGNSPLTKPSKILCTLEAEILLIL